MTAAASSLASKSNTALRPVAQRLLADRQYNIEFHGYLSNHVKHALIALDRLQAPQERVQEYWDDYTKVTPYNLVLEQVEQPNWDAVKPITASQWKDGSLRGTKTHWQEQVAFLNDELKRLDGDTNKLTALYAPDLIVTGVAGSLTHGIIHLGWGIDAQSPWMITEGLAYLSFGHVGIDPSKFSWNTKDDDSDSGPMDSLARVADAFKAEDLQATWIDRVKTSYDKNTFHPELVPAGFQWELATVLDDPHSVATTMPSWLTTKDTEKLWEEMYRTTVYLYLATRSLPSVEDPETHGNFLVLHLMTSLWGLEQTIKAVGTGSDAAASALDMQELTRKALGQFYASIVAVVAASKGGFPSAKDLQSIQKQFPATSNANEAVDRKVVDWAPIFKAGIAEDEEHNIKLVYVMKELWLRFGYWGGFVEAAKSFVLTPNIGPSATTSAFKA